MTGDRVRQYPTITAFEHHDSERTHRFDDTPALPTGPLRVDGRTAPQCYPGPYNMVTRDPGELFVLFGVYAEIDACTGAEVARIRADTLEEVWRVRIVDCTVDGRWNYMGVLGVLPDGDLVVVASDSIVRLDPATGATLDRATLPVNGPVRDGAYNGYTMLSDGTIVAKTVHRHGTEVDGFAAFMAGNPFAAPCSTVAAIDPDGFTLRSIIDAPEHIGGRITSTTLDGHDVVYLVGFNTLHRYRWDGTSLSVDPSWGGVTVRRDGQTPAPANAVFGSWTALQTNAVPSADPMSVHCIDQRDPAHRYEAQPFAISGAPVSFLPAMLSVDPEHQRIFSHDSAAGQMVALDVADGGGLAERWRVGQRSLSFTTIVGPDEARVVVGTDLPGVTVPAELMTTTVEQVVWRDADTGTELARSADLPRMSPGILVTPTFDGALFELGHRGELTELTIRSDS